MRLVVELQVTPDERLNGGAKTSMEYELQTTLRSIADQIVKRGLPGEGRVAAVDSKGRAIGFITWSEENG